MREVMGDIGRWLAQGEGVALATVVQTWGSAPRKAGAKMAVTPSGSLSGSVSGGCVEGAVYEAAVAALESHQPRLLHFGVADETAWEVGLACGGNIDIFVEGLRRDVYEAQRRLIDEERAGAVATVIGAADGDWVGRKLLVDMAGTQLGTVSATVDAEIVEGLRRAVRLGKNERVRVGELDVFMEVVLPPAQLVMVGGVHIAVALAEMATLLGYRTVVIDPRRAFGSAERFPHVDQLIQKWPVKAFGEVRVTENTAVALLTHDPKIDDPALGQILDGSAFYIGALGSRKTHAKRVARLQEKGFTPAQIERIHGPIGLDIGAQTPEEIAVAVLAQIVGARRKSS